MPDGLEKEWLQKRLVSGSWGCDWKPESPVSTPLGFFRGPDPSIFAAWKSRKNDKTGQKAVYCFTQEIQLLYCFHLCAVFLKFRRSFDVLFCRIPADCIRLSQLNTVGLDQCIRNFRSSTTQKSTDETINFRIYPNNRTLDIMFFQ